MVMREEAGFSTSYTITQVSKDPVATIVLFGDHAKQFMRALWYNMFLSFICFKIRTISDQFLCSRFMERFYIILITSLETLSHTTASLFKSADANIERSGE